MGTIKNIALAALMLTHLSNCSPKDENHNPSTKKDIVEVFSGNQKVDSSEERITMDVNDLTLQSDIAYFVDRNTDLYLDPDQNNILGTMPEGTFLRHSLINESQSNNNFICIQIQGKKVWIKKENLSNNTPEKYKDFFTPKTEKVIFIDKKNRNITVYDEYGKNKIAELDIGLSYNDIGDKTIQGDGKTPEGKYYIAGKNPASNFGKNPNTGGKLGSLHISYPNTQDAIEGLIAGNITQNEYKNIVYNDKQRNITNQNTGLGNYIMIHGGGSDRDWTIGCIALNDSDMLWLYNFIDTGADLFIR